MKNSLSQLTDLLVPGHLIALGGRPGMGKTSLACDLIADAIATGMPVYVSTELDADAITDRLSRRGRTPCLIFDPPNNKISDVASTLRSLDSDVSLAIYDYIGLSMSNVDADGILRELKELASSFHVPVLVVSSLHRAVEARDDKRPRLEDLPFDVGLFDSVCFLYSEDYYSLAPMNKAEAIISKSSFGEFSIPLRWDSDKLSFSHA